jgi:hypothetical protein
MKGTFSCSIQFYHSKSFINFSKLKTKKQYKAIQGKAIQGKAIQGKANQGKSRQGKSRQYKANQGKFKANQEG